MGIPTEGAAPPTELALGLLSPNPDNPRTEAGDLTELGTSLLNHGQKVAITVMNRDAYVKANPSREGELEEGAAYVVIDGSTRLHAAREVGLKKLKVMVDDDLGSDAEELLESALVANIHRQSLSEMDEARALQRLMAIHGTQSALARRLGKSQGWVSQRLALLGLTEELQARVDQEPIDLLRAVGKKPPAEQAALLERLKEEREDAAKSKRKARATAAAAEQVTGEGGTGTDSTGAAAKPEADATPDPANFPPASPRPGSGHDGTEAAAVETPTRGGSLPEPRNAGQPTPGDARTALKINPCADAEDIARSLINGLEPEVLVQLAVLLQQHNRQAVTRRRS
ncbi:ParB/RepB/Spo0J family partition protein [Streptomyces sp. NBC_01431]|uniref:ParB/RepB/Spo0J family partition protein n=1 Tax=Streptomyces sp. NBC_01431 TaxID=2903863 RepID=UPI002E365575|nr:ParB/RepB/Spo0J family partition protein [Streptomyces sp. NBC_01431]